MEHMILDIIWIDGETSNTWHHSFGGGMYTVPYTEARSLHVTYASSD